MQVMNAFSENRHKEIEVVDFHVHICPDNLALKNRTLIESLSGIKPVYSGSISELIRSMRQAKVDKCIVNNPVLKPELMKKANDFTYRVTQIYPQLIGMGWIVPGLVESVDEIDRCYSILKFRFFKIHHAHFKLLPTDQKNYPLYERLEQLGTPVLVHCGHNPYSKNGLQYCAPQNYVQVAKSFPKLKIIAGHMAGYVEDPHGATLLMDSSRQVIADTSVAPPMLQKIIRPMIESYGEERFVFGSDYPIYGQKDIMECIEKTLPKETCAKLLRGTVFGGLAKF
jgi:predicted TIM-barrel fold metal-dependent hydrolase